MIHQNGGTTLIKSRLCYVIPVTYPKLIYLFSNEENWPFSLISTLYFYRNTETLQNIKIYACFSYTYLPILVFLRHKQGNNLLSII